MIFLRRMKNIINFSVKGWNWGTGNFNGSVLNFEVGKHDAFEIPLTYVSHCSTAKNEVREKEMTIFSSLFR